MCSLRARHEEEMKSWDQSAQHFHPLSSCNHLMVYKSEHKKQVAIKRIKWYIDSSLLKPSKDTRQRSNWKRTKREHTTMQTLEWNLRSRSWVFLQFGISSGNQDILAVFYKQMDKPRAHRVHVASPVQLGYVLNFLQNLFQYIWEFNYQI